MWYYSEPEARKLTDHPFYLVSVGHHDRQNAILRGTDMERDQFLFCEHGGGVLKAGGREQAFAGLAACYLPAGMAHEYYPVEDVWDVRWVSCGGSGVRALIQSFGIEPGVVYPIENVTRLDNLINSMHTMAVYDQDYGIYEAGAELGHFILEFARQTGHLPKKAGRAEKSYERSMALLRDYIEYHYQGLITLEDLCGVLSVSPQHLCRIVKACTGMRPISYLNLVRIEKAKEYLKGTDYEIGDIAGWCGFENTNYFCRLFRKAEGMTPSDYRRLG